jgi:hypothetical protein
MSMFHLKRGEEFSPGSEGYFVDPLKALALTRLADFLEIRELVPNFRSGCGMPSELGREQLARRSICVIQVLSRVQ